MVKKPIGEWVAEIDPHFIAVPHSSTPESCPQCRGISDRTGKMCSSCDRVVPYVTSPVRTVIPITLATPGSQIYQNMITYKRPSHGPDPARANLQVQMSASLTLFLHQHRSCIEHAAGRRWDQIIPIPSKRGQTPHPLESVLRKSPYLRDQVKRLPIKYLGGQAPREPNEDAYEVTKSVAGRRILLVEDTFVTGATLQSVASRLTIEGAHVAAALVFARRTNPEWDRNEEVLEGLPQFDWETCCVH